MNRPLLFSAVVALSAHGVLFLFRPDANARPGVIAPPPEKRDVIIVAPLDPDPPMETSSDAPAKSSDMSPPVQVDQVSTVPNPTITMEVTKVRPGPTSNLSRIDPGALNFYGDRNGNGPRMGTPIGADKLDNSPRTRAQVAPVYPMEARRDGRGGSVTVEFTVDEQGRVLDPRVIDSSSREFEDSAVRAVQKWRFEPGRRDGRVVRFKMSVPLVFSISTD